MGKRVLTSLYVSYNAITEPIVQSQVIPYLRELSKKGIKFYLLTFEKEKIGEEKKKRIINRLNKQFATGAGVLEWRYLYYHKKPTLPATIFDIIAGCIKTIYIILKNKVDIVHARAVVAAAMACPAAKILSKKFIFDTRGIDSEEYVDAGLWKRGGIRHKAAAFTENILIRFSDHVVVLTEKFLKILKKKYHGKLKNVSVIPCAVDTNKFTPRKSRNSHLAGKLGVQDKFVITYIGSLGTWYMFAEMVDFFKAATKIIKNIHFLVLTQTDPGYAIQIIKNEGLESRVSIDTITYELMPDYLSICGAGIFFIKPVFSKLSSSPVKFGEYLASGLPVVINRGIGDTEEIVRKNRVGVVIEGFNERSYREGFMELQNLLSDAGLQTRCRRAAEEHLSLYAASEKYMDIYRILSGEKAAK